MKNSSCRGMEVFDFKEEDELPELSARQYLGKFKSPSIDDHSILKYRFLECVSHGSSEVPRKESNNVLCIDVETLGGDQSEENYNRCSGTDGEDDFTKKSDDGPNSALKFDSLGLGQHADIGEDKQEPKNLFSVIDMRTSSPGVSSSGRSQSNCAMSQSPSKDGSVDLNSDADENMNGQASSSFASDASLSGHAGSSRADSMELECTNEGVVIYPEYLIYRSNYYTEPQLTFSSSCVQIECSTPCDKGKSLTLMWEMDDLISISCQWMQKVQTILVKLRVISKDSIQSDNTHNSSCIEELKFAVVDPDWSMKQEMITTSNVKYLSIWEISTIADEDLDTILLSGERSYFPNFDEPFEDFIYPKGDADAVSISKRDVDLLQPETFVNDTIIDFYIKYLKNQIQPAQKHRFHFFNSFFFRKLADLDKDPSSASDGRAAFLRVRKWTRKLSLFEKDYIFIPVNYNLHWSLIVICHPGDVVHFKDENLSELSKVPCILHMDSIRGSHSGLKNLVQSYLLEEWKERGNETSEDISSKFSNLRFVALELPQQENSFDCGLFLLHYLELFLEEAPLAFNPLKISKNSRFLRVDWFPPVEASLKRTVIQKLIFELLDGQPHKASPAESSDDHQSSKILDARDENNYGVEPSEKCNPMTACDPAAQVDKGIEISLLGDSSMRSSRCVNESGQVLREFFEPVAAAGSFLGRCPSFDQPPYYHLNGSLSAMEPEDGDIGAQFSYVPYAPSGENGFGEINRVSHQAADVPCSPEGDRPEGLWRPGGSAQEEGECLNSPKRSICSPEAAQDIDLIENNHRGDLVIKDAGPNQECEADNFQSLPTEKGEHFADGLASTSEETPKIAMSDSENLGEMNDNGQEHVNLSSEENLVMLSQHDSDKPEPRLCGDDDTELDGCNQDIKEIADKEMASRDLGEAKCRQEPELDEQPSAKRLRPTPPTPQCEGNELGRSMSEDLHL